MFGGYTTSNRESGGLTIVGGIQLLEYSTVSFLWGGWGCTARVLPYLSVSLCSLLFFNLVQNITIILEYHDRVDKLL